MLLAHLPSAFRRPTRPPSTVHQKTMFARRLLIKSTRQTVAQTFCLSSPSCRSIVSLSRPLAHAEGSKSNSHITCTATARLPTTTATTVASMNRRWLSSGELPYHIVVGMPALSPTMSSGTISKWNVGDGDSFSAGDSLAVIETDKATIDVSLGCKS